MLLLSHTRSTGVDTPPINLSFLLLAEVPHAARQVPVSFCLHDRLQPHQFSPGGYLRLMNTSLCCSRHSRSSCSAGIRSCCYSRRRHPLVLIEPRQDQTQNGTSFPTSPHSLLQPLYSLCRLLLSSIFFLRCLIRSLSEVWLLTGRVAVDDHNHTQHCIVSYC